MIRPILEVIFSILNTYFAHSQNHQKQDLSFLEVQRRDYEFRKIDYPYPLHFKSLKMTLPESLGGKRFSVKRILV